MNSYAPRALLILLLTFAAFFAPRAEAATSCSAASTSLNFGTVSLTVPTDVSATFQVTCSTFGLLANIKVRMCLNIGDGTTGGGNFNPRRMLNATGDALNFQLYQDPARSQIWGSRGNPAVPNPLVVDFDYSAPLGGGSQTKTVTLYGQVPTPALPFAGHYTNTFDGFHISMEYRYDEATIFPPATPATCASGGDGGQTLWGNFPFTVSADVPANCRSYVATDLDFGSVPGLITANRDQTSVLSMICTGRTAWNVGLNNGLNASGAIRRMRQGTSGNYVNYELYRDPGRLNRWGTTIGTNTVPGTGTGLEQTLTVYGRVPATQTVPAGSYSDVITVTVSY